MSELKYDTITGSIHDLDITGDTLIVPAYKKVLYYQLK